LRWIRANKTSADAPNSLGIVIPAVFVGVTIAVSGFSFQLGLVCLPAREHGAVLLWAWLGGLGAVAAIVQSATCAFALVTRLRVRAWLRSKMPARVKAPAVSPRNRYSGYSFPTEAWRQTLSRPVSIAHRAGSMPNTVPGALHGNALGMGDAHVDDAELARTPLGRRWMSISKIFAAQWPSIVLSMLLIVESMLFAAVFWAEDIKIADLNTTTPSAVDLEACLIQSGGEKSECLALASSLTIRKEYIIASMTLMAVSSPHTHPHQSLRNANLC